MGIANLSTELLAKHCEDETQKYIRQQPNTTVYCFELMRRALSNNLADALTFIYQIYQPIVVRWVEHHPSFLLADDSPDYFASVAMSNFYFALQGTKFSQFTKLSKVLAYLKACVNSAIMQAFRNAPPIDVLVVQPDLPLRNPNDKPIDTPILRDELWQIVMDIFDNDQDRHLIVQYFIYGLKPREICEQYPDLWEDARDVSIALQRIRRNIHRNSKLRRYLGLENIRSD